MAHFVAHLAVLLLALLLVAQVVEADVVLRSCDTTECILDVTTNASASRVLLFYDSLDVSSVKVYNTLSLLKTRRTFNVNVFDIRDPRSAWLRSTFEVFYVPTLRYLKWTSSGRKILDGHQTVDFGAAALTQFLERH